MIVSIVVTPTGEVVIVNVTMVAPAGTVTVAGGAATLGLLLVIVTVAPPGGATLFRVSVPIVNEFAHAGFGLNTELFGKLTGRTVSVAVEVSPP